MSSFDHVFDESLSNRKHPEKSFPKGYKPPTRLKKNETIEELYERRANYDQKFFE